MAGKKDAAYWAARRAKEKQSQADRGQLQRPPGRAPANMRWDKVRGWVKKEEAEQAEQAPAADSQSAAPGTAAAPAAAAEAPDSAVIDAAPDTATAPAAAAVVAPDNVGRHALNVSYQEAASVASDAAAVAGAAAAKAGVALCGEFARAAVWAEERPILGHAAMEPRLDEYEARCRAEAHAQWATGAAVLCSLDPNDVDARQAVRDFSAAAEAPLDEALRMRAQKHYGWMGDEAIYRGAVYEQAVDEQWQRPLGPAPRRQPQTPSSLAWFARRAATDLCPVDGPWDGTATPHTCSHTGLARCPVAGEHAHSPTPRLANTSCSYLIAPLAGHTLRVGFTLRDDWQCEQCDCSIAVGQTVWYCDLCSCDISSAPAA